MSVRAVEDLITLSELNEESILETLRQRYESKSIYTYTGTILVALNPFAVLDIYDQEVVARYRGKKFESCPPHIYALAELAFATLSTLPQQSIIISGESGAGKSETTKLVLQYLTAVTAHKSQESWVEQQIIEANTILESFGNAKTIRNNNSSRFGKFIQVYFDDNNQIYGASFNHYLLEKSRIARQSQGERNYHIFYELLKGATQQERQQFKLLTANQYYYLSQSTSVDIDGVNDAQNFSQLKLAMQVMNFDPNFQNIVYRVLGAILSIGNIVFIESADKEAVQLHPSTQDAVDTITELLKISPEKFTQLLTVKRLVVRNETTLLPYKIASAVDNRDSIAKILYDVLFDKIVFNINFALSSKLSQAEQAAKLATKRKFIGVLDIFGFEIFQNNSFEQLCINFTNEKLQQVFVQLIFKFEQREYEQEGIDWSMLTFSDNMPCIELIENRGGVLSMLDEELKVPKGSDETWVEKMHNTHATNAYYFKPRMGKHLFGIKHYAGEVAYNSASFLEKNRDAVSEEILELFSESQLPLLAAMIKQKVTGSAAASSDSPAGGANSSPGTKQPESKGANASSSAPTRAAPPPPPSAKKTAGSSFKQSLSALVEVLTSTSTQFVRCIKPNQEKAAMTFNPAEVLNQLRYTGMLDTIRIRSDGYPRRYLLDVFYREYRFLMDGDLVKSAGLAAGVQKMVRDFKLSKAEVQIGKTKVFLKQSASSMLTNKNNEFLVAYAIKLQAFARMAIAKQRYKRQIAAAKKLNRVFRGYQCRVQYKRIRKATVVFQAFTRGWMARCFYAYLQQKKNGTANQQAEDAAASLPNFGAGAGSKFASQFESKNEKNVDALFGFLSGAGDPSAPVNGQNENNAANSNAMDLSTLMDQLGAHIDNVRMKVKDVNEKQRDAQRMADMGNKFARFVEKQMNDKDAEKINPDSPQLSLEVYISRYGNKFCRYKLGSQSKRTPMEHTKMLVYDPSVALSSALHRIYDSEIDEIALNCYKLLCKLASNAGKQVKKPQAANRPGAQVGLDAGDIPTIKEIVRVGIHYPALRDELYAQIIKLTNRNAASVDATEQSELEMLWFVAFLCASCFPPTKKLSKVWLAYVMRSSRVYETLTFSNAAAISRNLKRIEGSLRHIMVHGPRRLPPSQLELYCYREGVNLPCKITLPNGSTKSIAIYSTTTAMEALKSLANTVDLRDPSGWAIFQGAEGRKHVRATEYICDLLSDWELAVDQPIKTREQATELLLNSKSNALTLRKRLFILAQPPSTDPVAIRFLFHQMSSALLAGELTIPNLDFGVNIAAMLCHVHEGPFDESVKYPNNFGLKYIPKALWLDEQVKLVVQSIFLKYMDLSKAGPQLQTMNILLEALKALPEYGISKFNAIHDGFWAHSNQVIISVCSQYVAIDHPKTQARILKFAYKELKSVLVEQKTNVVLLQYEKSELKDGVATTEVETLRFKADEAADLVSLIKDYSPLMAAKKTKENASIFDTADSEFLEKDLESARWGLLKRQLLNLPGPDTCFKTGQKPKNVAVEQSGISGGASPLSPGSGGTLANPFSTMSSGANSPTKEALPFGTVKINTLSGSQGNLGPNSSGGTTKKLSNLTQKVRSKLTMRGTMKKGNSTFEQEEYEPTKEEQEAMYSVSDWSFSKNVIPASLRALNPEDGRFFDQCKWSVQLYTILLIYTGIHPGTLPKESDSKLPYGHIVQSLINRSMETPETIDELFLQLIKLTTNFPQADAAPCLEYWKVLAVACGCLIPSAPVLSLLKAHLAKYGACPKYYHVDRKQESEYAKYAQKSLRRAQLGFKRKNPPCIDEIYFVSHMTSMRLRIKFPDQQFRSFSIMPSTTCRDVVDLIESKLKLAKLLGWDLFERFAGVERPIGRSELIADLMYKWENFKRQQPYYELQELEFVYRRRFYVKHIDGPSPNEWEESMMRYQAIADLKNGLIPVERPEGVYLVALIVQGLNGDVVLNQPLHYKQLAETYLPTFWLENQNGIDVDIAKIHGSLRGISQEKANGLFMEYLRTWQFFGGSIFELTQNYTNELPTKLWVVVDINGVHILPVFQKMAIASYPFHSVVNYSSSAKTLLLVAGDLYRGTKYVLQSVQSNVICRTIKGYSDMAKLHAVPVKQANTTGMQASAPYVSSAGKTVGVKFR